LIFQLNRRTNPPGLRRFERFPFSFAVCNVAVLRIFDKKRFCGHDKAKPKSAMRSLRQFWWQCFTLAAKAAWKIYGQFRGAAALGTFASVLLGTYGYVTKELAPEINFWLVVAPVSLAVCSFLYFLIGAPHKLCSHHCLEADKQETELKSEIAQRERTIAELRGNMEKLLQFQLIRRIIRSNLGVFILGLHDRRRFIENINPLDYAKTQQAKEEAETRRMIKEIYKNIVDWGGPATAASFVSVKPELPPEPKDGFTYTLQDHAKATHLLLLDAHIAELKKMVEQYPPLDPGSPHWPLPEAPIDIINKLSRDSVSPPPQPRSQAL
jgi:hypothetical protein